jgi:hypothetical protein
MQERRKIKDRREKLLEQGLTARSYSRQIPDRRKCNIYPDLGKAEEDYVNLLDRMHVLWH